MNSAGPPRRDRARRLAADLTVAQRPTVASAARRLAPEFGTMGLDQMLEVAAQGCRDLDEYPAESLGELVETVTRQGLLDRTSNFRH